MSWTLESMHRTYFKCVSFSLVLALATSQHLAVLQSGYVKPAEPSVKMLKDGSVICPYDYANGFAIECRNGMVPPVKFWVDGEMVKKTSTWPYTLAEFKDGWRSPWQAYKGGSKQVIECKSSHGGPSQKAQISYGCNKVSKGLAPRTFTHSEEPAPTSTSTPVSRPKGEKYRWVGNRNCVLVNGATPDGPLTQGWSRENNGGVTWRHNDNWGGIVSPGTSTLTYSFYVPVESNYAISLDMETGHWTEHNDVFIRFQYGGGMALRRPGVFKDGGTHFHKAYHNQNGRAIEAKTVDYNGHSFSTISKLEPGVKYYITVGARSTKVTIHNIVLFPCSERQCNAFEWHWKDTVKTCK